MGLIRLNSLPLWKALTSAGSVLKILEIGGLVNFNRFKDARRNLLQEYYVRCQHGVTALFIAVHALSTIFRSKRYYPELYQSLFEDLGMILVFTETQVIRKNYQRLAELIQLMDTSFSSDDEEEMEACRQKVGVILSILFFVMGPTIACAWMETFIPLTQEEKDIRRYVYGVKYPEKRLPTNLWFPGVDESEVGYYELIFIWDVYMGFVMTLLFCCSSAVIPIIVVHIEGQYAILCKRIARFGVTHIQDEALEDKVSKAKKGNGLFFRPPRPFNFIKMIGDIEKMYKDGPGLIQVKPRREMKQNSREKEKGLRGIIGYHNRILIFQEKVSICID